MKKVLFKTDGMLRFRMYPIAILLCLTMLLDVLLPGISMPSTAAGSNEYVFAIVHIIIYWLITILFYSYVRNIDETARNVRSKHGNLIKKIVGAKCLRALLIIAAFYASLILVLVVTSLILVTNGRRTSLQHVYYIFSLIISTTVWPFFLSDRIYCILADLEITERKLSKYI